MTTPGMPPSILAPGQQPPNQEWTDIVEAPVASKSSSKAPPPGDRANSGVRREPELPAHEEVVRSPSNAAREFEPPRLEDAKVPTGGNLQRRFTDMARQASLDLGDDTGM